MNDRYGEALEQYELETGSVRKGRGAWICETDQGYKLLKEYRGTVKRLEFEDQVLSALKLPGFLKTDQYMRNREGSLLSITQDGTRYILKDWFIDPECDLKEKNQAGQALRQLACLHQALRQIPFQEEWNLGSIRTESLEAELERHNRELVRARNYISGKRRKNEFELCVMGNFQMFYRQAKEAVSGLQGLENASAADARLCHGDLDQHHVLQGRGYTAIVDYNRMHLGSQTTDLYRFMRKTMEKHGWDVVLGRQLLQSYEQILPLSAEERKCLYYQFLYPEKYWKQINFYFNTNKAWIPDRNIEKLRRLEQQQEVRNQFLQELF